MDSTVLQYFKTNHVPQVKDKLLQLTQDLAKNDDLLNQNLKLHYNDILNITEDVNHLYMNLQDTDTHFRKFCFDDAKYQLKKLPDFIQYSQNKDDNINNLCTYKVDNKSQDDHKMLLLISQWSLSVSKFLSIMVQQPLSNHNDDISNVNDNLFSNSLIDALFENFGKLINEKPSNISYIDPNFKYFKSIRDKIVCLQRKLIENSNLINLDHLQWIRFYDLINLKSIDILPWDSEMVSKLNDIIMDKIIRLVLFHNHILKDNETVKSFTDLKEFNLRLITHLKERIQNNLNKLESILKVNDEKVDQNMKINKIHKFSIDKYRDINSLIQNSKSLSLGLVDERRQEVYDLVEPTIEMIQGLIDYKCDHESLKVLQNQLIDILKEQCLKGTNLINVSTNTNDTDIHSNTTTLINDYVDSYHTNSFIHLIQSQIQRLESLL